MFLEWIWTLLGRIAFFTGTIGAKNSFPKPLSKEQEEKYLALVARGDKEAKDIQELRDELCVLSYGMLAALDGLKQLHCNGEVTKAHDMLSKHLNKQAHGQHNG